MERLLNVLALLRTRLWILPAFMSSGGVGLAYLLLGPFGAWTDFSEEKLWWLYSGDAGSARNLLGALLSGEITMTSLVVSLTFVTLTIAANQLGPRLIVMFIADRQIQAVFGFFLATILYLILVLRTVGDTLGPGSVPHLAITVASVLTISSMFALLYYVHKISRAIIADNVLREVYEDLRTFATDTLTRSTDDNPENASPTMPAVSRVVSLKKAGYVQTVDYEALISWARKHEAILNVRVKAGDFLLCEGRHVEIGAARDLSDDAVADLRSLVIVGSERSPAQDLGYSIRQLVELALRALSPGVNDPFTAMAAIDRLGAALELIFSFPPLPENLFDKDGALRIRASRTSWDDLANACFDQIRQASAQNPAVLGHLTDAIGKLGASCASASTAAVLNSHLDKLQEVAAHSTMVDSEKAALRDRFSTARRAIRETSDPGAA